MKQNFYDQKQFRLLTKRMLLLLLSFIFMSAIYAQEKTVTGSIVDKTGAPLPGVNVVIKGTTTGSVTDLNGNFTLKVPDNNTVLLITYVGYADQELTVGEQTKINIILTESVKEIDQVVVVGYGVQKKSDLTGAIASVSAEQLNKIPVTGLDQALQGRAAGVNIVQNSGMPGGTTTVAIRGISSINGTKPTVIVDGVTGSLDGLNPNDIQSVEILKDASSQAIYGASGGNGVILVTTKKGQAGKMVTSFDYYTGWQSPWKEMEMENSRQWAQTQNWVTMIRKPNTYLPIIDPDTLANYDWQKIMFHTAVQQNYNLSVSGGTDRSTFMISASYVKQDGMLHNSDYSRFTARINSEHKLSKIIKVGENVQFDNPYYNGYMASQVYEGNGEAIFNNAFNSPVPGILTMYPFLPAYDNQGNWSKTSATFATSNPKAAEDVMNQQKHGYNTGGNAYIDVNLFKGFTFTSKGSGYMNVTVLDGFTKEYYYAVNQQNTPDNITKEYQQAFGWQWQNYANYTTKIFKDHTIGVLAGIDASYSKDVNMKGTRLDLLNETPEMRYFDASTNDSTASQMVLGGAKERSLYAYFGRVNYDYKDKYLLTANFRKDYSSRFGPGNRSGSFPSFSLGWKFSEEDFVKNSLPFISYGKIRYGWGRTGANAPDDYSYFSSVDPSVAVFKYSIAHTKTPYSGAAPVIIANREIHWEAMVSNDIGLDLAFLKNSLSITIDYFSRYNDGMIIHVSEPSLAGIYQNPSYISNEGGDSRPLVNAGKISNKGVEVTIGYKMTVGDLKSSFDLNFSFTKNKVENLQGDSLPEGSVGVSLSNMTLTKVGHSISQFYGYKTNGIFRESDSKIDSKGKKVIWNQPFTLSTAGDTVWAQANAKPGDIRFVDINHDGKLNDNDKTFIGSPIPDFVFGFSINLEYKGFDFLAFFQGTLGNKIFNGSKLALMNQDIGGNRLAIVYNQYRSPLYSNTGILLDPGNTNTDLFRLDPKSENQNLTRVSDFYVEDGSYMRLKNIQLGYTLPKSLTQKVGVDNLRVYVGAKNLLTITKYSGFDPEIGPVSNLVYGLDAGGNYPQAKMFLFGVNLKF